MEQGGWGDGDLVLFVALVKLVVAEALGAVGVTGAAGSVRAGSMVGGCSVLRAAGSVALTEVVGACASIGATAGEAGRSSRITGRLVGGLSWAPACYARSAAAGSIVLAACSVTLTGVVSN